jgi:hypothetical protein
VSTRTAPVVLTRLTRGLRDGTERSAKQSQTRVDPLGDIPDTKMSIYGTAPTRYRTSVTVSPRVHEVVGGRLTELVPHWYPGAPLKRETPRKHGAKRDGRYWARTSDLRLVEAALSQLS